MQARWSGLGRNVQSNPRSPAPSDALTMGITSLSTSNPSTTSPLTHPVDRFEKEFDGVQDVFELQRNLNNCFAYDLVPSVEVLTAALKAARRVNDFPTAVRVFEGIKAKAETKEQYKQYLEALESLRLELGVPLREELYPEEQ
ncbi:COX5A-domain-containing protein [Aspergillus japonicus CBS 114.51]|uniref:Cytochrome c oxidase subunit 6, mitochondrial n=1 Tax=Aspergillus japonicus CBS 114.51 TaxID=1448312 RepID=A0A8T8XBE5_ASPJA|nr:COX5A-domain-containing protein [Aspergillus japonicus CBS 114.51]RAH85401.1 COX5A-domain-containing protein [Aspergillus japonicus CBS 114.51]